MSEGRKARVESQSVELTPQEIDEWRLRRDTEAMARGEKIASVGSSLNPNQAIDRGHKVMARRG